MCKSSRPLKEDDVGMDSMPGEAVSQMPAVLEHVTACKCRFHRKRV